MIVSLAHYVAPVSGTQSWSSALGFSSLAVSGCWLTSLLDSSSPSPCKVASSVAREFTGQSHTHTDCSVAVVMDHIQTLKSSLTQSKLDLHKR